MGDIVSLDSRRDKPEPPKPSAPASARGWTPSGTPWQVDCRTKRVAWFLRREAKWARRDAERMERLAARIETDRVAGRTVDRNHLHRALRFSPFVVATIAELAGLAKKSWLVTRDDIAEAFWPRRPAVAPVEKPAEVAQAIAPQMASGLNRTPGVTLASADVLAQATALARSARGETIDWSREALTERERAIRARFLERASGLEIAAISLRLLSEHKAQAADITMALKERNRQSFADAEERQRDQYREIIDELDDEAA